jgi:hypothetical protein
MKPIRFRARLGLKYTIIEHVFSVPKVEVQVPPPTVKSEGLAPLKRSELPAGYDD